MIFNPILTGGKKLPVLTDPGTAADLLAGKQLIDQNGEAITGTIATKTASDLTASGSSIIVPAGYYASQTNKSVETATQATPSISVSSAGLITASSTQTAGYVSAGTKSATRQLTTQAGKTVTPSTSTQTAVSSGRYTTGTVYVAGSSSLTAANIKSGVSIFGVTGTYEGASYKTWVGPADDIRAVFNPGISRVWVTLDFPVYVSEVIAMGLDFYNYDADEDGVILISPDTNPDLSGGYPYRTGRAYLVGNSFALDGDVEVVDGIIRITGTNSYANLLDGSNITERSLFGGFLIYK